MNRAAITLIPGVYSNPIWGGAEVSPEGMIEIVAERIVFVMPDGRRLAGSEVIDVLLKAATWFDQPINRA